MDRADEEVSAKPPFAKVISIETARRQSLPDPRLDSDSPSPLQRPPLRNPRHGKISGQAASRLEFVKEALTCWSGGKSASDTL